MTRSDAVLSIDPIGWEVRQKHASFHQTLLGSAQQAALAYNTAAVLLITIGLAMVKFSGVAADQDWAILFVTIIGWLVLSWALLVGFGRSACRIRMTYEAEHAALFPGAVPHRLESFLLDFVDRNTRIYRRQTAAGRNTCPGCRRAVGLQTGSVG